MYIQAMIVVVVSLLMVIRYSKTQLRTFCFKKYNAQTQKL